MGVGGGGGGLFIWIRGMPQIRNGRYDVLFRTNVGAGWPFEITQTLNNEGSWK